MDKEINHNLGDWLRGTGKNSDRYQSENILKCLHETGTKLKPCSCKHCSPHSEFLFPATRFFLFFASSVIDLERFSVFMKKIRTSPSLNRCELTRVGPAPETSESGPSLFFESVSCKQEQGFVWGAISSRTGLTSDRSHVISSSIYWQVNRYALMLQTQGIAKLGKKQRWTTPDNFIHVR